MIGHLTATPGKTASVTTKFKQEPQQNTAQFITQVTTRSIEETLKQAIAQIDLPADWIGMRAMRTNSSWRAMRDGRPQQNERGFDQGVMVEVLAEGQFGYSATNQLTPEALRSAAQQAYHQAISSSQWAVHRFTQAVRPKVTGQYISPYQRAFSDLSVGEINHIICYASYVNS